jgi:hypothetical protein
LICRVPVHRALIPWYAMVNPDVIVVRVEEQPFMLACPSPFQRRMLVYINAFSRNKNLRLTITPIRRRRQL